MALLQILMLFVAVLQVTSGANFVFGDCKAGRESCQECYQTLVESLLGSDENTVNLSIAFYPPQTNPAEFVSVTYQYVNQSTGDLAGVEKWFWSVSGSHFLHPLHVFTYMSLLFEKPEPYFAQTAAVTLSASCMGAKREHMILLTHRLKAFVEEQDASGKIDDSYNAMVADRDEVSRIIREENNRLTNVVIILQVTFVTFVVTLTVAATSLRRFTDFTRKRCNGKKHDSSKNIQQQSTIISISIITFHFLIYILVLDGVALYNRQNPPDPEISAIYWNKEPGDPFSIFYNLPLLVITFDATITIFSFIMVFIALLCCSFRYLKPEMDFGKKWVLFLKLSTVGLILVLLMHAPFISNAYLNDAFHASSVFIYYSAAIMIGFLLLKKVIIHTCLSSVWQAKHAKWEKPMKDTKITLCQGTLKVKKKGGSGIAQTVQLAGGYLILACDEAILVRKQFIGDHIKLKEGQLILSNNKANFKCTDSIEELHIEEGNLQVKHATAQWSYGDEEAPVDVKYGTKIKLANGGTLKVSYKEANGECQLLLKESELVGKEPRCMCCTKCLNSVPGAATCFILATIIMILLFLSLLGVLAFYFVLIPINMSISNAADRLVGIYQSFFVIVGALFAYKTLFKSPEPSGIEEALKERKKPLTDPEGAQGAQWASLSDKEKLNEFYGIVVDIVAQYYRNAKPSCNEEPSEIDTVNV